METKMSFRDFAVVFLIWVPMGVNALRCPAPTLDHGYFLPDKKAYAENEGLFYACDTEFKPDQEEWWAATTCTAGTWSTVPKCIAKDHCISLIIAHGEIQDKRADYVAGDTISISCQEGYHSENPQQVCSDGMWTPHPICKENQCGVTPQILNGKAQERGKVVTYSCSTGYVLVGVATVDCLSDGRWSDPPACEARGGARVETSPLPRKEEAPIERCGAIPVVQNAEQEIFAWNVLYRCTWGYRMRNSNSRIYCYTDGLWTTPLPECTWY
ncbi:complement factor H-related protein 1-like isoform X1 [Gadus macrocephalus]|uniref:complement factor H-related protein 1-like isoform X1 n=1 Tax=Gadus macrocephalus TaxID=80720 RepID=UPI0028CB6073|nr:complement factor H-related protein 1-like isoform X1 [Gadus macrocephalus]